MLCAVSDTLPHVVSKKRNLLLKKQNHEVTVTES